LYNKISGEYNSISEINSGLVAGLMQLVYFKWVRKTMVIEAWVIVIVILVGFVVMKMVVVLDEER
jgi:hypothetical protein